MLQVIERVLTSRSEATLVALIAFVAFLFLVLGLQDHARARVLARTEARFLARMDPREGLVSDHRAYRKIDPDHAERYRAGFAWRYEWCYQLHATILRFVHSATRTDPATHRKLAAGRFFG